MPSDEALDKHLRLRLTGKDQTILVDTTDATYNFYGWAPAGSNTVAGRAAAVWKIMRTGKPTTTAYAIEWANGTPAYAFVWDNRAALSYA